MNKQTKTFKVVSVSKNTNSFGLTGMILMAIDGETWEVGASYLNIKKKGDVVLTNRNFHGFEIPQQLPNAPLEVIEEVWGKNAIST